MKRLLPLLASAMVGITTLPGNAASTGEQPTKIALATGGKTSYRIIVDGKATEAERFAAGELARTLSRVTGADFPVIYREQEEPSGEPAGTGKPSIYVGAGAIPPDRLAGIPLETLTNDSIVMKSAGGDLYLFGAGPRGTLYSVYEFLESEVGCGWWTSSAATIPSRETLQIDVMDVVYTPRFDYRSSYFSDILEHPEFAAKLRSNALGHQPPYPARVGGSREIIGFVHTFATFLPPDQYFQDHPEWGGMRDGQRQGWEQMKGQPCLSNKEFTKAFTNEVLSRLKDAPEHSLISVSQNDNSYPCQCPQCLAIEKSEGSKSGPIIRFVNAVAAEIKKERPDVTVETLAYLYSVKPPSTTKPADNVLIRLCTYLDDHTAPMSDPKNRPFQEALEGWSKIAQKLQVWDYSTDFENQWKLRPNLLTIPTNIRTFSQVKNVTGIFSQGAYSQQSDFVGLRAWLTAKLLWNPEQSEEVLIKRYLSGYYGAAAPKLWEYIQWVDETAKSSDLVMGGGGVAQIAFPAAFFTKADDLFTEAEAAVADDPELLRRVQIERLAPDYLKIHRYPELRPGGELLFASPEDALAACDRFLEKAMSLGIDLERTTGGAGSTKQLMTLNKIRCNPVKPIPAGMPRGSTVIDFPASQLFLYSYGTLTHLVEDDEAAVGYAATIPVNRNDWGIQVPASPEMGDRAWNVTFRVRYDGTDTAQFTIAGFDAERGEKMGEQVHRITEEDGYKAFNVTVRRMVGTNFVYLAPAGTGENDGLLYVDRVIFEPR